jgi:hypothetical protein
MTFKLEAGEGQENLLEPSILIDQPSILGDSPMNSPRKYYDRDCQSSFRLDESKVLPIDPPMVMGENSALGFSNTDN